MILLLLISLCTAIPLHAEPGLLDATLLPERGLLLLTWPQQPGVQAWDLYRNDVALFQPAPENFFCSVSDTLCYDSLTTVKSFYRVMPHREEYLISASCRELILQPGAGNREEQTFLTVSSIGDSRALLTGLGLREDRQRASTLCWRDNALAAWNENDSLLLNQPLRFPPADPWSGLDNGRFGMLGGYPGFNYGSFAIAGGWQLTRQDSLLILEKDTLRSGRTASLRLLIDRNSNLLRQSEIWQTDRGLVSRYHYLTVDQQLLLKRREQFSYRADTLSRISISSFSDFNLAAEPITRNPAEWPPTPLPQLIPGPTPPDPDQYEDWSACPLLGEMENMSQRPRPEETGCTSCHDIVPPQGVLLMHGLNSNPAIFNLLQDWMESRYDCFFYRPFFDTDFTAAAMRDSLAARLGRLGNIRWLAIGHSLGGVVVRDLMQQQSGTAPVAGLITIGSPHNGATLLTNLHTAWGLFDDLRDDIEDLVSLELIDWLLGTSLDDAFDSLDDFLLQIESCAAREDLLPGSPFLQQLHNGSTSAPFRAVCCHDDYHHPIAELYAGLSTVFNYPYPYGSLDQIRNQRRDDFIGTWNYLENLTWNLRFIDQINDIHWDLVTMNNDWNCYVLEAEQEFTYPLYEYHEDNDCFFCPRPPFCGNGLEWCCHEQPQEPDGARFWCCWNCGGDQIVCYLGDASTTLELPNDAILTRQEQTWYCGDDSSQVIVAGVSHLGEKASDHVLEELEMILEEWGME